MRKTTLGKRLEVARLHAGYSSPELAACPRRPGRVPVTGREIRKYENDEHPPTFPKLRTLVLHYGTPAHVILDVPEFSL